MGSNNKPPPFISSRVRQGLLSSGLGRDFEKNSEILPNNHRFGLKTIRHSHG